jgi:2-amino-4-hydroxy-6-hydroxymethyldihydropteridine diphosphokinase
MAVQAYIALGSNLGDRQANLNSALERLRQTLGVKLVAVSRFWETDPAGGPPDQPRYLNAVCAVETELSPQQLHRELLRLKPSMVGNGARPMLRARSTWICCSTAPR